MEGPVCLIENTRFGGLQVNQEALDILSSIRQPVVVVSIVGMYRTGKSYLMNRLAGKRSGFSLGSTIQSETKGIWMWCVPHPRKNDHTLVLLDTEGLGDVEKGDEKNDTWIFALAVLLSSTLVYNSMRTIDNQALMSLHYVTQLTEHIKVKAYKEGDDSSEFIRFFPSFVWTVRDFTLDLEMNGKKITADEYLENSLKLRKGEAPQVAESNAPRNFIRMFFTARKCFVFDQPAKKRNLNKLETLSDAELDADFVKQGSEFCNYIYNDSKEKTIAGRVSVTGSMLGNLAAAYVEAIRSGSVPCLENAVLALSKIENSTAVEQSHALYRQLLGQRVKLHTETQEELSRVHEGCLREALEFFMKRSFKDENQVYQTQLMEFIEKEYDGKCSENAVQSQTHCTALLQQLWSKLHHESFMRPGGYTVYRIQMDSLIQTYKFTPGKGIKAEHALKDFISSKEDTCKKILLADKALTEQQRRLKEEQLRADRERYEAQLAKGELKIMTQKTVDLNQALKENARQLQKKFEEERKAMTEENNRVIEQRLKEQKALLEEGFQEKAMMMMQEIKEIASEAAMMQRENYMMMVLMDMRLMKINERLQDRDNCIIL
ncbi:hypothetical protein AGOR_G00189720 [Albula goreensis]|uniref:GB1/RHD3-type G domain-containing protein n=1 Tax=Albula goreensis TaxID=1534307 RepID=A0A8T3CTT4_9TELE|nr:hypothetical protein AGOR_G00189720 [Albula goreensis]